jgi:hypothetical protein
MVTATSTIWFVSMVAVVDSSRAWSPKSPATERTTARGSPSSLYRRTVDVVVTFGSNSMCSGTNLAVTGMPRR